MRSTRKLPLWWRIVSDISSSVASSLNETWVSLEKVNHLMTVSLKLVQNNILIIRGSSANWRKSSSLVKTNDDLVVTGEEWWRSTTAPRRGQAYDFILWSLGWFWFSRVLNLAMLFRHVLRWCLLWCWSKAQWTSLPKCTWTHGEQRQYREVTARTGHIYIAGCGEQFSWQFMMALARWQCHRRQEEATLQIWRQRPQSIIFSSQLNLTVLFSIN